MMSEGKMMTGGAAKAAAEALLGELASVARSGMAGSLSGLAASAGEGTRSLAQADGRSVDAYGVESSALGQYTSAIGARSHAEGTQSDALGEGAHAEGFATYAAGARSHAEGSATRTSGGSSHAEGYATAATGDYSHAEGQYSEASGTSSHSEGSMTLASGGSSHAEGRWTTASEDYSHAEGVNSTASGINSHAEGNATTASGNSSHAEGAYSEASGACSHAEGLDTVAASESQHAAGRYNVEDADGRYAEVVGNGTYDSRANARTLDWQGNAWHAGEVTATEAVTEEVDGQEVTTLVSHNLTEKASMAQVVALLASKADASLMADLSRRVALLELGFDPATVSWADGSWDDIRAMLAAHYAGGLDIRDYWSVGDTRTVSLSAMEATGVTESHAAQDVELILVDADNANELADGSGNAAFVVHQKNLLGYGANASETGNMHNAATTWLGWDSCDMRAWCNNVFFSALPSELQQLVKAVKVIGAQWGYDKSDVAQTSEDKVFLPAYFEIVQRRQVNLCPEAERGLPLWEYYETNGSAKKLVKPGEDNSYWTRTPYYRTYTDYSTVDSYGGMGNATANKTWLGIAPAFCI